MTGIVKPYQFPTEEAVFQRRVIMLRSVNRVPQWWLATYVGSMIALSIIGAVAFAWPAIVERVNSANERIV